MNWPPETASAVLDAIRLDVVANVAPLIQAGGINPIRFRLEDLSGMSHPSPPEPTECVLFTASAASAASAALCWGIALIHNVQFEGIEPTGLPVIVKGVTVLTKGPGTERLLRRYIDWHYVLAQLGSLPGRSTAPTLSPSG